MRIPKINLSSLHGPSYKSKKGYTMKRFSDLNSDYQRYLTVDDGYNSKKISQVAFDDSGNVREIYRDSELPSEIFLIDDHLNLPKYNYNNLYLYKDVYLKSNPKFNRVSAADKDGMFIAGTMSKFPKSFDNMLGHGFDKAINFSDAFADLRMILDNGSAPSRSMNNFSLAGFKKIPGDGSAIGTGDGRPYLLGWFTVYGDADKIIKSSENSNIHLSKDSIKGVIINDGYESSKVLLENVKTAKQYLKLHYPDLEIHLMSEFVDFKMKSGGKLNYLNYIK